VIREARQAHTLRQNIGAWLSNLAGIAIATPNRKFAKGAEKRQSTQMPRARQDWMQLLTARFNIWCHSLKPGAGASIAVKLLFNQVETFKQVAS
jgi:hypothetical protein